MILRIFLFSLLLNLFVWSPATAQNRDSLAVYVFLLESCPVCQSITPELNRLYGLFKDSAVQFTGVFPNSELSNGETIADFRRKYKIYFPLQLDSAQILTTKFFAKVTPQVFLVNKRTSEVLYSGRIDNSYEAVNKRRSVITDRFLENAIRESVIGRKPNPGKTQAVGCLIKSI